MKHDHNITRPTDLRYLDPAVERSLGARRIAVAIVILFWLGCVCALLAHQGGLL